MRIPGTRIEVPGFPLFLLACTIAFFTRDYFDPIPVPFSYFAVAILVFGFSVKDVIVWQAKDKMGKIIGNGIQDSYVRDKYVYLGNNIYGFGLGAYQTDWMGSSKGENGVVLVHKSLMKFKGINLLLDGDIHEIEQLSYRWAKKIKKYYGYVPDDIYVIRPSKNHIPKNSEIYEELENMKQTNYVSDMVAELHTLSIENYFMAKTLESMGVSVDTFIDRATGMADSVLKLFKKKGAQIVKKEEKSE